MATESGASRIAQVASKERQEAVKLLNAILQPRDRLSVYLFQPLRLEDLREESPGVLFDVGPLPDALAGTNRDLLYTCAKAGRLGRFLESAANCLSRTPDSAAIDKDADKSFRHFNPREQVRVAQLTVEAARHSFKLKKRDGPLTDRVIHHLALAPGIVTVEALRARTIPVLGAVFTLSKEESPTHIEFTNLADYAMLIGHELLEKRASLLIGGGPDDEGFLGDAIRVLPLDPAADAAVLLAVRFLFAHHWFFPYRAVGYALLKKALGSGERADQLYADHGWLPPLRYLPDAKEPTLEETRDEVVRDLEVLVHHLGWRRFGQRYRQSYAASAGRTQVARAVNTAVVLLCGTSRPVRTPSDTVGLGSNGLVLAPTWDGGSKMCGDKTGVLLPIFREESVLNLARSRGETLKRRFDRCWKACMPAEAFQEARVHAKPVGFIKSFQDIEEPVFAQFPPGRTEERTKWLCSYSFARLAASRASRRAAPDGA